MAGALITQYVYIVDLVFCYPIGLYGVGKAAIHPPALVVLSHTPDGATKTIAWVGKGIVYDTGGLSMKTKVSTKGHHSDSHMIMIIIIITYYYIIFTFLFYFIFI